MTIDGRAHSNILDLKLASGEQETRFEECELKREKKEKNVVREDVIDMKHSRNARCSKKQGQLELIFIECYPSSWSKGEMERTNKFG